MLQGGRFELENIAEGFGISGRTLQRNLSAENTSFNQLVKDVQKIMTFNRRNHLSSRIYRNFIFLSGIQKMDLKNSIAVSERKG